MQGQSVVEGEIVAVLGVDSYSSCISCKGKVNNLNDVIGECSKCSCKMKMSRCEQNLSVRFMVEGDGKQTWRLTAFKHEVEAIVAGETGASIAEKMLLVDNIKFYVSSGNIVKNVVKNH